ncbi:hypothetical protein GIB67_021272, partial [Kingdonia uniflora]
TVSTAFSTTRKINVHSRIKLHLNLSQLVTKVGIQCFPNIWSSFQYMNFRLGRHTMSP